MTHGEKPKKTDAQRQKEREDLFNHLIGFHGVDRALLTKRSYDGLKRIHSEVKEVRWCRINRSSQDKPRRYNG